MFALIVKTFKGVYGVSQLEILKMPPPFSYISESSSVGCTITFILMFCCT